MLPTNPRRPVSLVLLALPVIVYVFLIYRYAFNFPFLDDYDTVLSHALLPFGEQIKNWFAPHNEHIHLVLKAAATFDSFIFSHINLVRLIWLGVVFFLLFYAALLHQARTSGLDWIWLAPVPFLLFQPSYWGTMTWATTALHNFPGLLFAFLAIFLWKKSKPPALIFTLLALLTNGFGIAVVGSLLLWAAWDTVENRRLKTLPANSYASLMQLALVLAGWLLFRTWQGEQNLLHSIRIASPSDAFLFFTNFLGSCIHFLGAPWITLLAIGQMLVFPWLLKSGLVKNHPEWMFFLVYLFLAAVVTTCGRSDMGPSQALASRYRIYSTLFVCVLYLGCALIHGNSWKQKAWLSPTLTTIAFVYFSASLFVNVNNLEKIRTRLSADRSRWTNLEPIREFPMPEHAERVLREAEEAALFSQSDLAVSPANP